MRVEDPLLLNATVSQDGVRVVYTLGPNADGRGYVIETAGGVPKALCEGCQLYGFLSDNRRVLAVWNELQR